MAEASQYVFNFKELTEMLVKKQGLHEGQWAILVRFGIGAANVAMGGGDPLPTALVPIIEIGIQRESNTTPLTVDAAKVNPRPPREGRKKGR
jgi:hypothetical protein